MLRQIFLFSVSILIQQAIAQAYLPPGLGIDSSHAPFIYGVASGDPTDQSVVLWTYVDGISSGQSTVIQYEISTDSLFVNSVLTGTQIVDSSTAFTLKSK
jgi:alkaline phosphatase D